MTLDAGLFDYFANLDHTRESWDSYFMKIAFTIATRSTCLSRQVGCICVDRKSKRILATGYNGAPKGLTHCIDTGKCHRKDSESGSNLQDCIAVHAEMNVIVQAASSGVNLEGGILYCTTFPCIHCAKLIINTGISKLYYVEDYPSIAKDLFRSAGIEMIQMSKAGNKFIIE